MDLPREVPVMTLPSATLFPQALLPLYIFEPRYRRMLADTLKQDRVFAVAMQKPNCKREIPCAIAGLGLIRVSVDHKDGTSHLVLQGLTRVQLVKTVRYKPYRVQEIRPLQLDCKETPAIDNLLSRVFELVKQRMDLGATPFPFPMVQSDLKDTPDGADESSALETADVLSYLQRLPDAEQVTDLVSCALLPSPDHRQKLLETVDLEPRLTYLIRFLMEEIRRQRKASQG